ncbi:MAG: NAD(P)-dependent oxidoreductase [Bauldia sp.]|uniref:NAD-dependent epimerase/dehydratase family protein n=1 Tax=Bauldia sp. TaxID=2575872 RepID=UPI001DC86C9A|nr:NAD(P)-dependent oxidoreductase [Bauldia sp.]MCB1488002.1 NAD(P)-dependent oxidoreductase [Bauldia sp.]MCB1495464.1 NAD(P)-dependent oxidoreductase [Bauldia sp.]
MRALVTGGAGLVGLAVRRALAERGDEAIGVDRTDFGRDDPTLRLVSFAETDRLESLMRDEGVEAVVHAGGLSSPVMGAEDPLRTVDINITATAFLLDAARRLGASRFVFCSSHVVYGDVGPGTIDEDHPLKPASAYAASKVAGEALVSAFARAYGLPGASLRITRVYGPYRRAECPFRRIVGDHAAGLATTIACDPAFPYHYVHVDDVACAVLACLDAKDLPSDVLNVTSGERLTMPEVVDRVHAVLPDARIELVDGADPAPEVQDDFSLARWDGIWFPRYDLRTGFARYLAAMPESGVIRL